MKGLRRLAVLWVPPATLRFSYGEPILELADTLPQGLLSRFVSECWLIRPGLCNLGLPEQLGVRLTLGHIRANAHQERSSMSDRSLQLHKWFPFLHS